VLRDAAAGLPSKDIAVKYAVSRAWVDRVKQRRRETGLRREVGPAVSARELRVASHSFAEICSSLSRAASAKHCIATMSYRDSY